MEKIKIINYIKKIDDKEYLNILKEVLKIRIERKIIYKNSYSLMPKWVLAGSIWSKTDRLKEFIINNSDQTKYENVLDTIYDLINYALFLGANIKREKNENK
ncbi:MAG: hypothetical protein KAX49_13135 [Halanaerobiales bacterium]|nr:hypothetical protein [Halanaerobiales bacterium]